MSSATTKSATVKHVTSKDGTVLYADSVGDIRNKHIVFLHGLQTSAAVFNDIFANEKYSSQFYMVRFDLRGFGRSTKYETPDGYSSQKIAEDYSAVAEAFGIKRAILVGWSFGCTVLADIAEVLPHDTVSGAICMAALPYLGPIMHEVATPAVLGFLPGLMSTDDVALAMKTKIDFVDSAFADANTKSYEFKAQCIGIAVAQSPAVVSSIFARQQDPAKLFAMGKDGLPLLIVHGTADAQVKHDAVIESMKPHFPNMSVRLFEGSGHAVFLDDMEGVMSSISEFVQNIKQ